MTGSSRVSPALSAVSVSGYSPAVTFCAGLTATVIEEVAPASTGTDEVALAPDGVNVTFQPSGAPAADIE